MNIGAGDAYLVAEIYALWDLSVWFFAGKEILSIGSVHLKHFLYNLQHILISQSI